ncbi:Do family serine endopeptidase [Neotabrizicola shimadae]|uniref:Do family serine endopeptidase n=1 Tax=Neotabrizicola shimadae TaxID=2807096 RepID=A0A8G1EDF5_9RHOB|nr:Do family serine endopeptidase [Neotabrizicola shimadae]QYZ70123.1 Do family serine endopeptidase [Neotabrizicola shimadae]
MSRLRLAPVVSLVAVAGLAALALHAETAAPDPDAASTVPASQAQIDLSFAPVVHSAAPAVVNIYATRVVDQKASPFAGDPLFERLFGDLAPTTPRVQNSLGSGVIVGSDGIVVTNFHVVGSATEIRVVLNDRREYAATVMLGDEDSDLAILKLDGASDLPSLAFTDSDAIEVGDLVLAIGNPFGVGQTVSSGIVSGLARSSTAVGDGLGAFIQTDAAINPGNSGGALVDMQGRLVGINTAILSRTGGSLGIGFAIPANLVAQVVTQAQAGSDRFTKPWAGLTGQAVDAATAEAMGLPRPDGVVLSSVHPESPFAAAGLKAGDVITEVDGLPVNSPQEIVLRIATRGVGAKVDVSWLRDGEAQGATVLLIAAPDSPAREARTISGDTPLDGLSVARINPAVLEELDLPPKADGIVVTQAGRTSAAAGFRAGDLILAINGAEVGSTADVETLALSGDRRWRIDLVRQGKPVRLQFRY